MIQKPWKLTRRKWWVANTYITARITSSSTPVMPVRGGVGRCQGDHGSPTGALPGLGRALPVLGMGMQVCLLGVLTWNSLEEPPVVLLWELRPGDEQVITPWSGQSKLLVSAFILICAQDSLSGLCFKFHLPIVGKDSGEEAGQHAERCD